METPSHPHLAALLTDVRGVGDEARRLRDSLSDEQLVWRPDERSWSVAECFEHLRKVDKAYCRALGTPLERAKRQPGAPFRPTIVGRLYFWGVAPTVRFRMPTFSAVTPRSVDAGSGHAVMRRFLEQQEQLAALILRADACDINTGRISSPLAPIVRISLGEALTVLAMHEQRHAAQARRVTEHPAFPASGAP